MSPYLGRRHRAGRFVRSQGAEGLHDRTWWAHAPVSWG